ncbi:conserved hypothetical protein [Neospora caninum Liverpool]|uniref:Uncharacterized protein n=1 Tax=Neospora caninum (strain Liverpool) TaxID=572307 RepID=F0VHX2_NEOCL|nr:conserved hypothetical protein [Neospora caninum Liverpool]CBZ53333.1 conserved hypothetical protein [Neospora caninum Liverpool]CEL67318.1 TPA: hypothetical protein BN1204_031200 [Neospora caninum Liverpool]|eukprot:XP_003883365.1 conserved hypothetical protein [Neospora caninum Liverpool]
MFLTSFFDGARPPDTSVSTASEGPSRSASSTLGRGAVSSSSSPASQPQRIQPQDALRQKWPQQSGAPASSLSPAPSSASSAEAPERNAPWTDLRDVLRHQLAPRQRASSPPPSHPSFASSSTPSSASGVSSAPRSAPVSCPLGSALPSLSLSTEQTETSPRGGQPRPPSAENGGWSAGSSASSLSGERREDTPSVADSPGPENSEHYAVRRSGEFFEAGQRPETATRPSCSPGCDRPLHAASPPFHAVSSSPFQSASEPPSAEFSSSESSYPRNSNTSSSPLKEAVSSSPFACSSAPSSSFSASSLSSSAEGPGSGRSLASALDSLVLQDVRSPAPSSLFAPTRVFQVTARGLSTTRNFLLGEGERREMGCAAEPQTRPEDGARSETARRDAPDRGQDGAAREAEAAIRENADGAAKTEDRGGAVLYLPAQTATRMRFLATKRHLENWLPRRLPVARLATSGLLPDPTRWTETAPWLERQLARHCLRREDARLRVWMLPQSRAPAPERERRERESRDTRGNTAGPEASGKRREEARGREEARERERVFPGKETLENRGVDARADGERRRKVRGERNSLPELWELREAVQEQRRELVRRGRSGELDEDSEGEGSEGEGSGEGRVSRRLVQAVARVEALLRVEEAQLRRLRNGEEISVEDEAGETGSKKAGGLVEAAAANLAKVGYLGQQVQDVQRSVARLRGHEAGETKERMREDGEHGHGENEAGQSEEEVLMTELMDQLAEVALLEMKERFLTQLTHLLELTESARRLLDRLLLLPSDSSSPPAFLATAGHLLVLLTHVAEEARVQALPPATRLHANQRLRSLIQRARGCLMAFLRAALKSMEWGTMVPKKPVPEAETGATRGTAGSETDANDAGGEKATPFSPLFLVLGGLFALQELDGACTEAPKQPEKKTRWRRAQEGRKAGEAQDEGGESPSNTTRRVVGQTAASHPEKVWAIQALASPLAAAFHFHFCREEGGPLMRLDKPEWAREFLLKQLERHEDLLYDSAGVDWVDPEDCRVEQVLQKSSNAPSASGSALVSHFFLPDLAGHSRKHDMHMPSTPWLRGVYGDATSTETETGDREEAEGERKAREEGLHALEIAACSLSLHVDPAEGLQLILADAFRQFLFDRMPLLIFVPVSSAVPDAPHAPVAPQTSPLGASSSSTGHGEELEAGRPRQNGEGVAVAEGESGLGASSQETAAPASTQVEVAAPNSGSASLFLFHLQQALDLFGLWKDQGSLRAASVIVRDFNENALVYPPGAGPLASPQGQSQGEAGAGGVGRKANKRGRRRRDTRQDKDGGETRSEAETTGIDETDRPIPARDKDGAERRGARGIGEGSVTEGRQEAGTGSGGFSLLRGLVTAALREDSDRESVQGGDTPQAVSAVARGRQGGRGGTPDAESAAETPRERDTDGDASEFSGSEMSEDSDTVKKEEQEDWVSLNFFDTAKPADRPFPGPVGMLEFWITLDAAFLTRAIEQLIADGAATQPHALATFLQHPPDLQRLLAFSSELVVAAVALFDAASPRVGALSQDDAIESFYRGVFGPSLRRLLETLKAAWNSLDSLATSPALCGLLLESTNALCLYLDPRKWLAEPNEERSEREDPAVFLLRAFFRRFLASEVEALETMRSRMEAFILLEVSEHVEAAAPRLAKAIAPFDSALRLLEGFTAQLDARLQRDLRRRALQQLDHRVLEITSSSLATLTGRETFLLLGENCMHLRNEAGRLLPSTSAALGASAAEAEDPLPRTYAVGRLLLEPSTVSKENSGSAWTAERESKAARVSARGAECASRRAPDGSTEEQENQENQAFDANKQEMTRENRGRGGKQETVDSQEDRGGKLQFLMNPLARVQHAAGAFWQLASVESGRGVSEDFKTRGETECLRDACGEGAMASKEVAALEETFRLPRGVLTRQELLQLVSLRRAATP